MTWFTKKGERYSKTYRYSTSSYIYTSGYASS
jgi:hypothetical protein